MVKESHRGAAVGQHGRFGSRWRNGFRNVVRAFSGENDLWSVSAGVAFYAWYAAVFGVVFLVSLYGLAADPQTVRAKIEGLSGKLPAESVQFLAKQMQTVASRPRVQLSTSLGVSFLVVLWYARSAVATLIAALNTAFQTREKRNFLHLQVVTLMLTAGAAGFVTTAVAVALLVPTAAAAWIADPAERDMISDARWPALAILMWLALATLYRFAPCRVKSHWRWASRGAMVATVLWVLGSAGFSYFVTTFSSGNVAFGALSAVLLMQTWFYIAAVVVLLGAKLNAEAERPLAEGGAE